MWVRTVRELGASIRSNRSARHLSQTDLAKRAGVSRKWVSELESGKSTVEVGLVLQVLDALDLDIRLVPRPESEPGGGGRVDLDDHLRKYGQR